MEIVATPFVLRQSIAVVIAPLCFSGGVIFPQGDNKAK